MTKSTMVEQVGLKNIEPLQDYSIFRKDADGEEAANKLLAEFEGDAELAPTEQDAIKTKEIKQDESLPQESILKRVAKDISRGVFAEGGRSIVSGATKGVNEMVDIANDFNQFMGDKFAEGVLSVVGSEKQQAAGEKIIRERKDENVKLLPQPTFGVDGEESPKSITGNIIEDITQFLTGFGVAGKALKGVKAGGKIAKNVTQAMIGDVIAFDEQEQRLSNVIQSVPELQNPVTDFLESDEDDNVAEGKFKQAIEGLGMGIVGEGLGKAVKLLRKNKKVKNTLESQLEGKIKAEEPGLKDNSLEVLGRPQSNKLVYNKVALAKKETANLTPEQIDKLSSKKPTNADDIAINFARIDSPEELKQAMQAYANETSLLPKVKDARRGVRTNEVTLRDAEDIDAFKTLLNRRSGEALNAEQITASRNFYYSTTDKLMELAKKASDPEATDVDQYAFRKMVATHHAVQKEILGARAEAGRALQAWSIPATGTPTEKLKDLEAILDSFGGADASKDLARKLASFDNGQLNMAQINYITQKSAYARTRDAMVEAWTAGLLTNPVTHVKNLSSNTLVTLLSAAERYGQALLPNSQVTINEANNFVKGIIQSQKEATANAGRAFRTGQTGFGQSKIELPRTRASSKEVLDLQGMARPFAYAMDYYGRVINTSFKALAAGDEYSKTVLYKAQLNALATREGMQKGFKNSELTDYVANVVSSPNQLLQQEARDFANYSTFTNELGKSGKAMQRILSQNPALRIVIPFFKTPVNIFKFTYERTPLALGMRKIREDLAAGGTREAEALVKMGMGSSFMMLGVDMAVNGNITGKGPSDNKKKAALRRLGWQPNSIKIGDKYYSYDGLEPLSTLFAFSSNMAEILTNYEMYDIAAQDEIDKISTATVLAISEATVNKTFLQGISSIMEAISDPERQGDYYIKRTLSSLVPSGVAAAERAVSPEKEYAGSIIESFKSRIPGFSDSLAKRRNVYGEIIQYRYPDETILDKTASGIISLFNPFYVSAEKESELDSFLLKEGLFVGMPAKTQSFENQKINLSDYPHIYSRFLELRGQEAELIKYGGESMKQTLTDLIKEDSIYSIRFFSDFTDNEEKQDLINNIVSDYSQEAKEILREEFPIIDQLILEEQLKQEQGE